MRQDSDYVRRSPLRCLLRLILFTSIASTITVANAQTRAELEASAKPNAVIQFESSQFTANASSNVGHSYRGDLNASQQYREAFRLVLRRGQAAVFELVSKSFDAKLQVFSAEGHELASDDDSGEELKSARLVFVAPPDRTGSFYLVTSSVDNRGGSFVLTATPQAAPAAASIIRVTPGVEISGRFDQKSALRVEQQEIASSYSFDTDTAGRILIEARSEGLPLRLELHQNDKMVAVGSTKPAGASLYVPAAAVGRYRVDVITKPDSAGTFTLMVKKLPKQRAAAAVPLSVGGTVEGTFSEDSPTVSPVSNRPYGLYEIRGAAAGDKIAISADLENINGSVGYDAPPLTIAIGADTPAGFAELSSTMSPPLIGTVRATVSFLRPGAVLVRIVGRSGAISKFTASAEAIAPTSEAGAPDPASN